MSPPDNSANPSNVIPFEMRLSTVERFAVTHGESLARHNNEIAELKTAKAVQVERDRSLYERLDRIDDAIESLASSNNTKFNGIYKLGWWVLAAFGGSFIALLANFIFKGGFVV